MTRSILYREGDDARALLDELEQEYPGRVRVIDVQQVREGGVCGFFAFRKVGVHYELDLDDVETPSVAELSPIDELVTNADAADGFVSAAPVTATYSRTVDPHSGMGNAEFAALLMQMAAEKTASASMAARATRSANVSLSADTAVLTETRRRPKPYPTPESVARDAARKAAAMTAPAARTGAAQPPPAKSLALALAEDRARRAHRPRHLLRAG